MQWSHPNQVNRIDYLPLNHARSETRLLEIEPMTEIAPSSDRQIDIHLENVSIDHISDYVCLSYVWGRSLDHNISVNRKSLRITQNLDIALRNFRSLNHDTAPGLWHTIPELKRKKLWIDAICIDQDNIKEKEYQIKLMQRIYSNASQVFVWLGEFTEELSLALSWIEHLCKSCPFSTFKTLSWENIWHYYNERCWKAVQSLFEHVCFRRRWIVQEIALSKNPVIVCGSFLMEWNTLWDGIERCAAMSMASRNISRPQHMPAADAGSISNIEAIRYARKNGIAEPLFINLLRGQRKNATRAHDMIYGLLSLCSATESNSQILNYGQPVAEVFIEQSLVHTQLYDNLDFLNVRTDLFGESVSTKHLPTWSPDWTSVNVKWLLGPDMLVPGLSTNPIYCASGNYPPQLLDDYETIRKTGKLRAKGILVDVITTISQVGPPHIDDVYNPDPNLPIFSHYLSLILNSNPNSLPEAVLVDIFFKSITCGSICERTPMALAVVRQQCMQFFSPYTRVGQRLAKYQSYAGPLPPGTQHVRSGETISFNNLAHFKAFVTRAGYAGLCPPQSQVNDYVAVLFGCSSPLVLWPMGTTGVFGLRGEAYIWKLMEGEAIDMLHQGKLRSQDICLY